MLLMCSFESAEAHPITLKLGEGNRKKLKKVDPGKQNIGDFSPYLFYAAQLDKLHQITDIYADYLDSRQGKLRLIRSRMDEEEDSDIF